MTPAPPQPGTGSRVAVSAGKGGCLLGLIGFTGGFFGPMILSPESNQGPMLGIFFTGPAGLVLGLLIGAIVGWCRRRLECLQGPVGSGFGSKRAKTARSGLSCCSSPASCSARC